MVESMEVLEMNGRYKMRNPKQYSYVNIQWPQISGSAGGKIYSLMNRW